MRPAIVCGIVSGDAQVLAQVSYWPIPFYPFYPLSCEGQLDPVSFSSLK